MTLAKDIIIILRKYPARKSVLFGVHSRYRRRVAAQAGFGKISMVSTIPVEKG